MSISLCIRPDEARRQTVDAKRKGMKVGLVPTMGALHQGHLSLVKASASDCDFTVVSIFVNPTQFGVGEDFEQYPRDLDQDLECLRGTGVNMVFAPGVDEIYRPGHSTYVHPPASAHALEGKERPQHFRGVTTVVLKLFQIVPADVAFFGQKDYQQTRVIQDMAADLNVPISIQMCPIVREPDGLALSSRNAYLSEAERSQAVSISQALKLAVELTQRGVCHSAEIQAAMTLHLQKAGIEKIDYVALVHPLTLDPIAEVTSGTVALIAAYCGTTRLIDNVRIG